MFTYLFDYSNVNRSFSYGCIELYPLDLVVILLKVLQIEAFYFKMFKHLFPYTPLEDVTSTPHYIVYSLDTLLIFIFSIVRFSGWGGGPPAKISPRAANCLEPALTTYRRAEVELLIMANSVCPKIHILTGSWTVY